MRLHKLALDSRLRFATSFLGTPTAKSWFSLLKVQNEWGFHSGCFHCRTQQSWQWTSFLRQRRAAHGSQIFMTQDKGLTVNAVPDNDGTGSDKDFNPQTMAKTRYQIFRTSQFRPSESQKRTEAIEKRKMRWASPIHQQTSIISNHQLLGRRSLIHSNAQERPLQLWRSFAVSEPLWEANRKEERNQDHCKWMILHLHSVESSWADKHCRYDQQWHPRVILWNFIHVAYRDLFLFLIFL